MSYDEDLIVLIPVGELGYNSFWARMLDRESPLSKDFAQLMQKGRVIIESNPYPHANAYRLMQRAMEVPGWKRALYLEHDHEFPEDVFRRHSAYREPVVGGLYVLRDYREPLPVIFKWDGSRYNAEQYNAEELFEMGIGGPDDKRGLHEVDVVPLGCTSIRRDVFDTWPEDKPVFSSYTNPKGKAISHDVWFCRIAQDIGWPIHVDTSLRVQHYAQVPIDDSFFTRWWNQIGAQRAVEWAGVPA